MNSSGPEKTQILIVDDSRVIRLAAKKMLSRDYIVQLAEDGQQGWDYLQQHTSISVVFSDLNMPYMDGMALLKKIRESEKRSLSELPVVILTGVEDDEGVKQRAMDAGATDFILKPFSSIDLLSRAKSYAQLSRKVVELEERSAYDQLTGLYTANALAEQGIKAVSYAQRHHLPVSVCVVEITGVQQYFLRFGKKVAQTILLTVVKRLQAIMRQEDVAARLGLSRFALILPHTDEQQTRMMVARIEQAISKLVFDLGSEKIHLVLHVGCSALSMAGNVSFQQLLQQAIDVLASLQCTDGTQQAYYHEKGRQKQVSAEKDKCSGSVTVLSANALTQCCRDIMAGEFASVPEAALSVLVEKFTAFIQYVDQGDSDQIKK